MEGVGHKFMLDKDKVNPVLKYIIKLCAMKAHGGVEVQFYHS